MGREGVGVEGEDFWRFQGCRRRVNGLPDDLQTEGGGRASRKTPQGKERLVYTSGTRRPAGSRVTDTGAQTTYHWLQFKESEHLYRHH
ncbi:unnamed protein product [Danaus chrysippus]|uniref:(African queen) hypothetical protein n=1 Tax=Danaus chrysippus TaxID=151541 RepID=A0A8J2QYX3_9NEOP|nr:unnamed protein product [Danaus chrysippus]